jgi:hypothetical protein
MTDQEILEHLRHIADGLSTAERQLHHGGMGARNNDMIRADLRDLTWETEDLITAIKEAH